MSTVDLHVHAFASAPHERRVQTPALSIRTRLVLAAALLVPALASVWLMAAPKTMTASTYSISATVVVALAALAMVFRSARVSGTSP